MVLHFLGSDVDYLESKECMCFLRNLNQIGRSARTHQIQGCLLGTYQKRLECFCGISIVLDVFGGVSWFWCLQLVLFFLFLVFVSVSLFGWGVLSVFLHMSAVMILYVSALGWFRVSICFWGALVSEFACVFFGVVLSQCLCLCRGIVISGLAFCCFFAFE